MLTTLTINSQIENFELVNSQIDSIKDEAEPDDCKPVITQTIAEQEKRAEEINQQFLDLELKLMQNEAYSEDDEDFDL